MERWGLPLKPHATFHIADLDQRQELYRRLTEQVWGPAGLAKELEGATS